MEYFPSMGEEGEMRDRYSIIGPLYDVLAKLYSAGRIDRCKLAMHDVIRPDDTVLFAGVGQGIDAVAAAERGARVTVIDLSRSMLDIFSKRISGRHFLHPIEVIHTDILKYDEFGKFDMVFANFFLNVFTRPMVMAVIEHLVKLAKPGGYMVVGDFALPSGSAAARAVQSLYWYIADIFFVLTARNAFHPVYDYQTMLKGLGLKIERVRYFRLLFDDRYCSILARKD
jgi:ubiquinone/menaquinone biosynthesis C-methylase UbiE